MKNPIYNKQKIESSIREERLRINAIENKHLQCV